MDTKGIPEELEYFPKEKVIAVVVDLDETFYSGYPVGTPLSTQVVRIARTGANELVVPILERQYPRKGFLDRVYFEDGLSRVIVVVRDTVDLHFPVDPKIKSYLLLLRPIPEEEWRVWHVEAGQVQNGRELRFPKFEELATLDDWPDGEKIREKMEAALKAQERLSGHF